MSKQLRMQVTLKGGAQIEVDVDSFTVKYLDSETTSLEWVTSQDWRSKLHYLNVREVVAVVAVQ